MTSALRTIEGPQVKYQGKSYSIDLHSQSNLPLGQGPREGLGDIVGRIAGIKSLDDQILGAYRSGSTWKDIQEQTGASKYKIGKVLHENLKEGEFRSRSKKSTFGQKRNPFTQEQKEYMRDAYNSDMNVDDIREEFKEKFGEKLGNSKLYETLREQEANGENINWRGKNNSTRKETAANIEDLVHAANAVEAAYDPITNEITPTTNYAVSAQEIRNAYGPQLDDLLAKVNPEDVVESRRGEFFKERAKREYEKVITDREVEAFVSTYGIDLALEIDPQISEMLKSIAQLKVKTKAPQKIALVDYFAPKFKAPFAGKDEFTGERVSQEYAPTEERFSEEFGSAGSEDEEEIKVPSREMYESAIGKTPSVDDLVNDAPNETEKDALVRKLIREGNSTKVAEVTNGTYVPKAKETNQTPQRIPDYRIEDAIRKHELDALHYLRNGLRDKAEEHVIKLINIATDESFAAVKRITDFNNKAKKQGENWGVLDTPIVNIDSNLTPEQIEERNERIRLDEGLVEINGRKKRRKEQRKRVFSGASKATVGISKVAAALTLVSALSASGIPRQQPLNNSIPIGEDGATKSNETQQSPSNEQKSSQSGTSSGYDTPYFNYFPDDSAAWLNAHLGEDGPSGDPFSGKF